MPFSNHLLITCQSQRKQISLSKHWGISIRLLRPSPLKLKLFFSPCRSNEYSFRSAGKDDSENRGWWGCWHKNRLKRAKNIVNLVLSWVSFKSEVWNYVYKMPKYVLSLDVSKVKKKKKKKKNLSVCFALQRLPCFRVKGQIRRVAAFWHHKSIDKTGVTTAPHRTIQHQVKYCTALTKNYNKQKKKKKKKKNSSLT